MRRRMKDLDQKDGEEGQERAVGNPSDEHCS